LQGIGLVVAVLRIRCLPASETLPKIVAGPAHIKMISMNGTRNEREGVMNGSRVEDTVLFRSIRLSRVTPIFFYPGFFFSQIFRFSEIFRKCKNANFWPN
jgi:hypothetical protein